MQDYKIVSIPLMTNKKLKIEDGAKKANPTVFRSIEGSLIYLTATGPDIMLATNLLSRHMNSPCYLCLAATKLVLRYIKCPKDYGIWYKPVEESKLIGFTDSDWTGCLEDKKST